MSALETVWAVRGLPLNDELHLCTFLDVRAHQDLLPYPRDWFIHKIYEHFMASGGSLRLVPWTVEQAERILKNEDPMQPIVLIVIEPLRSPDFIPIEIAAST